MDYLHSLGWQSEVGVPEYSSQDYVNNLHGSSNVVLIDGEKLAEYIYTYSIGMQIEQVVEIKKMDADFWDAMQEG